MSTTRQPPPSPAKYDERTIVNFPNEVTTIRLGLSIALFVLLHFHWYWASFWLFIIAAGTDWLDGFWARRYGQITILGRMLDPFVDKVIIVGTYIFLAADPNSGLAAWMAVLVLGRELLVTALAQLSGTARGRFFRGHFRQAQIHFAIAPPSEPVCIGLATSRATRRSSQTSQRLLPQTGCCGFNGSW